ncbi:MAG: hypothetical protein ACRBHB_10340 [Arenicella sp.]
MNKIILKLIFSGILTLSATSALAAGAWTGWQKVAIVYVQGNGDIYVQFSPSSAQLNPDGCASKVWYRVQNSNEHAKEIYQLLLTAKASDSNARAYLSGCEGSYPILHHAMIW